MLGIKGTHDCLSVLFTVTAFLKNTRKYIASWLDALRFLQYFKRVYSEAHQLCVNIFEWCNSRKYMIFLTLQRCMQCFETSRWPQNKPFRSVDYAGFITYTFHTHTHTHMYTHTSQGWPDPLLVFMPNWAAKPQDAEKEKNRGELSQRLSKPTGFVTLSR